MHTVEKYIVMLYMYLTNRLKGKKHVLMCKDKETKENLWTWHFWTRQNTRFGRVCLDWGNGRLANWNWIKFVSFVIKLCNKHMFARSHAQISNKMPPETWRILTYNTLQYRTLQPPNTGRTWILKHSWTSSPSKFFNKKLSHGSKLWHSASHTKIAGKWMFLRHECGT